MTREETGLEVRPLRLLGVFGGLEERVRYANGDEAEFTTIVFECDVAGGALRAEAGESTVARFVPLADLPPLRGRYAARVLALGPDALPLFDPPGRGSAA